MSQFKIETINCIKCKGLNIVKPKDFEALFFICSHKKCGVRNDLNNFVYDENITNGLPNFGTVISNIHPSERYSLKLGSNILGRGNMADVQLRARAKGSDGGPLMSRLHCTIEVKFNKWLGELVYILSDGVTDANTRIKTNSTNFTFRNGNKLELQDEIYLANNDILRLGGDEFCLETYVIPHLMLQTYKKFNKNFDSESTTD